VTAADAPRRRRLSSEARGMLPWCIALSAALHVLLLASLAPAGPRLGGLVRHGGGHAGGRPVSVRLVPEKVPAPQRDAARSGSVDEAVGAAQVPVMVAHAASATPAAASASEPAASAKAVAPAPASASESTLASGSVPVPAQHDYASASAALSAPDAPADGGYVPRPLLSVVPDALAPVIIATSPETADLGRRVGVLALYIDEQGRVRRIEAEQPALPEAMERAAREAFMAARFSPGQVDGHVVKSRIRVEVVFDDEPLPEPAAADAASGASGATSDSAATPAPRAPSAVASRASSPQRSP